MSTARTVTITTLAQVERQAVRLSDGTVLWLDLPVDTRTPEQKARELALVYGDRG